MELNFINIPINFFERILNEFNYYLEKIVKKSVAFVFLIKIIWRVITREFLNYIECLNHIAVRKTRAKNNRIKYGKPGPNEVDSNRRA